MKWILNETIQIGGKCTTVIIHATIFHFFLIVQLVGWPHSFQISGFVVVWWAQQFHTSNVVECWSLTGKSQAQLCLPNAQWLILLCTAVWFFSIVFLFFCFCFIYFIVGDRCCSCTVNDIVYSIHVLLTLVANWVKSEPASRQAFVVWTIANERTNVRKRE